jgi:hypothetical protein
MTESDRSENRQVFIRRVLRGIHRDGKEELLEWLEKNGFFEAPSSAGYHLAEPGGLCRHSLNVHDRALQDHFRNREDYPKVTEESIAIAALFHDLCKVGAYELYLKNVKGEDGKWTKVPAYRYTNDTPMGHGEKSLWIVQRFMPLTEEEAMAIRWHMGAFDDAVKGGFRNLGQVYSTYPLAYMIHQADEKATYFDENT